MYEVNKFERVVNQLRDAVPPPSLKKKRRPDNVNRSVMRKECNLTAQQSSLAFGPLPAMKRHARRLFITALQNSSEVVLISVRNFVTVARPPL
ncbi:hypothetical protein EVAR_48015_1 [Eumeta japonica]|uniref:Uncharacterized protein n=1 Tax=Eumeta variegata TaxID=151549 RepID=A0A4C1XSZ4_EUMVA|nr:hypothetical protein EVAR_48015_1 [Eumeta japonica]